MKTKAMLILILVLIGVVAFMALGGGALRDRREGTAPPKDYDDPDAGIEAIEGATGWLRSKFDRRRIRSECWTGSGFSFPTQCEVTIGPGSVRPSRFRLEPAGGVVRLCFAMSREKLAKCVLGVGDIRMKELERAADFTVARDSAFIVMACAGAGGTG